MPLLPLLISSSPSPPQLSSPWANEPAAHRPRAGFFELWIFPFWILSSFYFSKANLNLSLNKSTFFKLRETHGWTNENSFSRDFTPMGPNRKFSISIFSIQLCWRGKKEDAKLITHIIFIFWDLRFSLWSPFASLFDLVSGLFLEGFWKNMAAKEG